MNDYSDSPAVLTEYLNYLTVIKNRSKLTILNYYTDIKTFMRFLIMDNGLSGKCEFNEINIANISESIIRNVDLDTAMKFLSFCSTTLNNQPNARARKAVAIRRFYEYLTDKKKDWFTVSPLAKLSLPSPKKGLPKHLTLNECEVLLNSFGNLEKWSDYRDYCIVVWFLNCGMRLSELVGVNINHIILNSDSNSDNVYYTLNVLGKGSKERIVYLNSACVDAYKNYIAHRPELKNEKALFVSKQYKRISNRRVEQIIEDKLHASGLAGKGISVHKLRHTAATLMYQNGVDVRVLKEVLGHENLNTTQIYTHVANSQIQNAMDMNPLADKISHKTDNNDKKK